jgi:hypothetical protein
MGRYLLVFDHPFGEFAIKVSGAIIGNPHNLQGITLTYNDIHAAVAAMKDAGIPTELCEEAANRSNSSDCTFIEVDVEHGKQMGAFQITP